MHQKTTSDLDEREAGCSTRIPAETGSVHPTELLDFHRRQDADLQRPRRTRERDSSIRKFLQLLDLFSTSEYWRC